MAMANDSKQQTPFMAGTSAIDSCGVEAANAFEQATTLFPQTTLPDAVLIIGTAQAGGRKKGRQFPLASRHFSRF